MDRFVARMAQSRFLVYRNHMTLESHDMTSNAAISAKQRNLVSPIKNSRLM
jgi:hypothetical protein